MRKASTPALLVSLLLLAACSAGARSNHAGRARRPPPRVGDKLTGTNWQAVSMDGQPVANPARDDVHFLPGRSGLAVRPAATAIVGPFASRDDKITLGILRQSRLPCDRRETAQQQQLIYLLHRAWRTELGARLAGPLRPAGRRSSLRAVAR